MDVPNGLVTEADISTVLDEELDKPPALLPINPVWPALQARRTDVANWAYAQVSGSFTPSPQEIVAVSKTRHAVRPVALWDLPSRLLYRALTANLTHDLQFPQRSADAWRTFERGPLQSSQPRDYVVAADIASCYELIDHALLGQELLIQAGNHRLVDALLALLRESSGRTYGLPQQCSASDLLAEIFLDKLERSLHRRGLNVSRYNDDFRFVCKSWSQVIRTIEVLTEEARNHGLILNDSKLVTWGRAKYEQYLNEADELRDRIAAEVQLDMESFHFEGYDGTFDPDFEEDDDEDEGGDEDEENLDEGVTAVRILDRWHLIASSGRIDEGDRAEHRALLQLLPHAFNILSGIRSDIEDSVGTAMQMLRFEQTMTPYISRFLITRQDHASVISEFDKLLARNAYLTGWQKWWLQQPLTKIPDFVNGNKAAARKDWIKEIFNSAERPSALQAQASMSLARFGMIGEDELLRVYDRSTPVSRPVVVAAIAILNPGKAVANAVTRDGQLNRWIFDWARANA